MTLKIIIWIGLCLLAAGFAGWIIHGYWRGFKQMQDQQRRHLEHKELLRRLHEKLEWLKIKSPYFQDVQLKAINVLLKGDKAELEALEREIDQILAA